MHVAECYFLPVEGDRVAENRRDCIQKKVDPTPPRAHLDIVSDQQVEMSCIEHPALHSDPTRSILLIRFLFLLL
jgi:hypothetical protein